MGRGLGGGKSVSVAFSKFVPDELTVCEDGSSRYVLNIPLR